MTLRAGQPLRQFRAQARARFQQRLKADRIRSHADEGVSVFIGDVLVVAEQEMGIASRLTFEKMVVGDTQDGLTILCDIDEDIESTKEGLVMDGYNKREIKKMKVRHTNTVSFSY